jgi:predicted nucleic acid-binding protein
LELVQTDAAAVLSSGTRVANVLALAERRRRITPAESTELIALLETLEIVVDEETPARAFTRVLDLARQERLTAYDAAYLELAMRLGVPLASKDAGLCGAAERLGVSVLRAA